MKNIISHSLSTVFQLNLFFVWLKYWTNSTDFSKILAKLLRWYARQQGSEINMISDVRLGRHLTSSKSPCRLLRLTKPDDLSQWFLSLSLLAVRSKSLPMTGETFRPLALFPPWLHPHHIKVHVHQQVFHDLPLLKFRFVQNSWSHDCFGSWFAIKLRPWRQSELGSDDDDDDDGLNSPKHIILVPSLLDS